MKANIKHAQKMKTRYMGKQMVIKTEKIFTPDQNESANRAKKKSKNHAKHHKKIHQKKHQEMKENKTYTHTKVATNRCH